MSRCFAKDAEAYDVYNDQLYMRNPSAASKLTSSISKREYLDAITSSDLGQSNEVNVKGEQDIVDLSR
jgi:hypothetical protein